MIRSDFAGLAIHCIVIAYVLTGTILILLIFTPGHGKHSVYTNKIGYRKKHHT